MRRSIWLPTLGAALLSLVSIHNVARAQTVGATVSYAAGTVLVSGPPGTDFSAVDGPLSTLQTGDQAYESVQSSAGTKAGFGYWAQFDAPATVQLSQGSASPYTTSVLSGQWILIGDPSGSLPATVTGATAVYTYDPTNGYKAATLLQPGQGAWALGSGSGSITLTPQTAAAASAAATFRPFSGQGFQIGIPAGWDRLSTGQPSSAGDLWASADENLFMGVSGPMPLPAGAPINAVRILTALFTSTDPKAPLATLHNGQVSSPAALTTIQGADTAAEASFSATDDDGQPLQMTFVLAIGNDNLYILVIGDGSASPAQDQALIQQLIQSFQLTAS